MDWLSATLGLLFVRIVVGGAVVLVMFYLSMGYIVLAATLLVPLVGVLVWMAVDTYRGSPPELLDQEW